MADRRRDGGILGSMPNNAFTFDPDKGYTSPLDINFGGGSRTNNNFTTPTVTDYVSSNVNTPQSFDWTQNTMADYNLTGLSSSVPSIDGPASLDFGETSYIDPSQRMLDQMDRRIDMQESAMGTNRALGWTSFSIQAASAIGNLVMGIKNYNLAKKQFRFERDAARANLSNQVGQAKNAIKDRANLAHWDSPEAQRAWERERTDQFQTI